MRAQGVSDVDIYSGYGERIAAELVGARNSPIRDIHDLSDKVDKFSSMVKKDFQDVHTELANLGTKVAELPSKQDYENLVAKNENLSGQVAELSGQVERLSGQVAELSGQVAELSGQVADLPTAVSKCILEIFKRGLDSLPPANGSVLPSYPQLLY